jgi:outer membrane protein insertion porin family
MTSGGTYREQAFERDLAVLAYFYGNEGYINAKFAKPRVSLSQDRRYIDVFIDVEEGLRYELGRVRFSGDNLFSEESLAETFKMKESDVFSTGKLQEEIMRLTDKYGDEGYAFANVIPRPLMQEGKSVVDLQIDIERGEKVYWGKIIVSGNTKTHDKVIRRELPFAEGELYNATKRKRGVEKVRRLGFFGNEVSFTTSTPSGKNEVIDLEIKVSEKPTGSLNLTAGYGGGAGGFIMRGQVSQSNLFGRGQFLAATLTYEKTSKQFDLQFTDPKAFDTEWLMGGDVYYQVSNVGGLNVRRTYDQELAGAALRLGRELSEDVMLFGTYKISQSQIHNPISEDLFQDPGSENDRNSVVSSLGANLSYDTRNNRLDPFDGEYASLSGEFAGLGGRVFQKYALNARLYRRPIWKFTFRSNLELGLLTNVLNDDNVPLTERYVMGYYSLRGYPISSVGPSIRVTPTRDDVPEALRTPFDYVVGGTKKLLFTQEVEFPLIPEADIRGVLFFDAGNTWDDLSQRRPAILADYGWGFRWYSPLGPLRIEFGYPLSTIPSKTERTPEFIFAIQPPF